LNKSKFRSSFKLYEKDKLIVIEKGMETMKKHAKEILEKRIRQKIRNDRK